MFIYIPYFYIIQHKETGKYYAGSKYAKDANPDNFMVKGGYQTSSETITGIIEEQGLESFTIRKIRIFKEGHQAHNYETRFLRKVNAAAHPLFYNGHNNDNYFDPEVRKKRMLIKYGYEHPAQVPEILAKIIETNKKTLKERYNVNHNFWIPFVQENIKNNNLEKYGFEHFSQTEEWKNKTITTNNEIYGVDWPIQSNDIKEKSRETSNERYGVDHWAQSGEGKEILRRKTKEQFSDAYEKEKHRIACIEKNSGRGRICINRNKENKRIYPEEYEKYVSQGWNKGRFIDEANAFWNYDRNGSNNPFFGKKHNKSTKEAISIKNKKKYEDPEYKENHRKTCIEKNKEKYDSKSGNIIWVTDGNENKRIAIEHYDPKTGWIRGRTLKRNKNET